MTTTKRLIATGYKTSQGKDIYMCDPPAEIQGRALRARFVGCGAEVWTVFDPPATPPTLAALPASCLQPR